MPCPTLPLSFNCSPYSAILPTSLSLTSPFSPFLLHVYTSAQHDQRLPPLHYYSSYIFSLPFSNHATYQSQLSALYSCHSSSQLHQNPTICLLPFTIIQSSSHSSIRFPITYNLVCTCASFLHTSLTSLHATCFSTCLISSINRPSSPPPYPKYFQTALQVLKPPHSIPNLHRFHHHFLQQRILTHHQNPHSKHFHIPSHALQQHIFSSYCGDILLGATSQPPPKAWLPT